MADWYPQFYETFDDPNEAKRRSKEILASEEFTLFALKQGPGFDPATDYKVRTSGGRIIPYREFDPIRAKQIETISRKLKGAHVFYFETNNADSLTFSLADETRAGRAPLLPAQ